MKKSSSFWIALLALSVALNLCLHFGGSSETERTADTLVVRDTIKVRVPVAVDSMVVRYVMRTLEVSAPKRPLKADSAANHPVEPSDTMAARDSVEVVVPISQTVYRDSMYTAWVSGYEARLDSIKVYRLHTTITRPAPKPKRWGIGMQAGYGATRQGLSPYIGVGVQYNLIGF